MQLNVLVCVFVCRLNYHVTVRSQNYVIISQYWPTCDQAKQLLAGLGGDFLVCLTIVSYLVISDNPHICTENTILPEKLSKSM